MIFSNQLFIEEDCKSSSSYLNLEEKKELHNITSVYKTCVSCSQDFEVPYSSTVDNRDGSIFISPMLLLQETIILLLHPKIRYLFQ